MPYSLPTLPRALIRQLSLWQGENLIRPTLQSSKQLLSFAQSTGLAKQGTSTRIYRTSFRAKQAQNWTYKFGHRRVGLGDFVKSFAPLSYFSIRFGTSPLLCWPLPPPPPPAY
jgi:hypothetical protein